MSFDSDTTSLQDSQPIELYAFTLGADLVRLTNRHDDYVDGLFTYSASTVGRNQPTYSIEKAGSEMQISISEGDAAAADLINAWRSRAPSGQAAVSIVEVEPSGQRSFWTGFVVSVNFNDDVVTFLCRPLSGILSKTAPRRGFGRLCEHTLFDGRCGLVAASFTQLGTITGLTSDGLTYTIPGLVAETITWVSGYLKEATGFAEGMVIAQSGDTFTVRYPIPELQIGTSVLVVEGCDHSTTDCVAASNILNFGGFPYAPDDVNPFDKGLDKA